MATISKQWRKKHQQWEERKPKIRLIGLEVEFLGPGQGYAVVIEGFNLYGAISPPKVTVGGIPLEHPEFYPNGRFIRGKLSRKPQSDRVVVDYGFARAELRGKRK